MQGDGRASAIPPPLADDGGSLLGIQMNIEHIKKCQKERTCGGCGSTIVIGMPYFKGTTSISPETVRCEECGLETWQGAILECLQGVDQIKYMWLDRNNNNMFSQGEEAIFPMISDVKKYASDAQKHFDNKPDNIQSSTNGVILEKHISSAKKVADALEQISVDQIKKEVLDDYYKNEQIPSDEITFDDFVDGLNANDVIRIELLNTVTESINDAIEEALRNMDA